MKTAEDVARALATQGSCLREENVAQYRILLDALTSAVHNPDVAQGL